MKTANLRYPLNYFWMVRYRSKLYSIAPDPFLSNISDTPVAQKTADEFFKSDLTDPPQIFDAHLLENTNLSPSSFHFSVGFYIKTCFESDDFKAYPNE